MTGAGWMYALATLASAVGMWLALPRGRAPGRALGLLLVAVGVGLFGSRLPAVAGWLGQSVFLVLAAVTVLAAVGAVTFRSPLYCAVWFGLSLMGAAGLFLFQGAQFLAVATIVVYAGAILVTLLFVLMLANPEGRASYDRVSWEAPLAAVVGMVIVGVLTITLANTVGRMPEAEANKVTAEARQADILNGQHVARLGAQLFSRHLIAVELAGTLLLVALVGAVAIAVHSRPSADGSRETTGGPPGA